MARPTSVHSSDLKRRSILKEMPPTNFYGINHSSNLTNLQKRVKFEEENGSWKTIPKSVLHPFKGSLTNGDLVYKFFNRQKDCLEYLAACKDGSMRVFSVENDMDSDGLFFYVGVYVFQKFITIRTIDRQKEVNW